MFPPVIGTTSEYDTAHYVEIEIQTITNRYSEISVVKLKTNITVQYYRSVYTYYLLLSVSPTLGIFPEILGYLIIFWDLIGNTDYCNRLNIWRRNSDQTNPSIQLEHLYFVQIISVVNFITNPSGRPLTKPRAVTSTRVP